MKKRISALLLLFLILFAGLISSCSQDNEILATSSIKNITRQDFYDWLDAKKIKKEFIQGNKDVQIKLLTSMAFEIFIVDKARSEGFDKSRRLTLFREQIKDSTLKKYLRSTITNITTYNEPAIRVSYILLPIDLLKQDPNDKTRKIRLDQYEVDKKISESILKANNIIKKLDAGESFEKLATLYSGDSTKKSGGDYGYIFKYMMPSYFSDPAFKLNKDEYTKMPVMSQKGIYIIKVTDRVDLTDKNIDRIVEDKKRHNSMKSSQLSRYKNNYIAALENADDVELLYEKGKTYNNTDVIFRIEAKEYTLADIKKIIEGMVPLKQLKKIHENGVLEKMSLFKAKNLFKNLILTREALRLGVDKSPEYLKEVKEKEINLIMEQYITSQLLRGVIISDQEIMEEYEKEKEMYSDKLLEKGVVFDEPVTLDIVRDDIIKELKKKAIGEKGKIEKEKILEMYSFKINETALQGN